MRDSALSFYNQLASSYHLIFNEWEQAISNQGEILNKFIRSKMDLDSLEQISLLDCSCGIGTQAIGLARHGFKVTATDISPVSVERAKREAENLKVNNINWGVADFRALEQEVSGVFNVVMSADNAISHLLNDEDLHLAFKNMNSKLVKNGLLLLTIRDYDSIIHDQPTATTPYIFENGKRIVFQTWNWDENGKTYMIQLFILQQENEKWVTQHFKTKYRALMQQEINKMLSETGFSNIQWFTAKESGYYQPIVIARKISN
ncbi:hypothetical protein J14TS2_20480 [Bacillus sp. J14TS2]|uniref:class I SAM-dependent methyltransferase n=1 Tax=Bacillus sp. J14TS2 TaxID=2807188 RepID=UPI001B16F115|nr:class I SAM-dependent methyltransferase [Bacillus sp. J14TS2]GIN71573.1 hypothetical protein J14TS2_20480 [Bacillus sp. J14TS2]